MSSEKESLSSIPQSPLPDAPPAYDTLTAAAATATLLESIANSNVQGGPNQPIMLPADPPTNNKSPPSFPPPPSMPKTHKRTPSSSSTTSLKSKRSWFKFSSSPSSSRTLNNEVRTTVIGLLKDLVRDHSSGSPAALGILTSCAEVCASHSISLSEILQDKFIESHSPLYWAIVKRPRGETEGDVISQDSDLVGAILARCTPLNAETISELRLACLATSDQVMFQRLRSHFSSASGADQVLLGTDPHMDDVVVELGAGTEGAFAVTFEIPQYHKRMMISKEIGLEFVARNRIWRFALVITPDGAWYGPPPGSWCVSLSLQEPSPPTWLDANLSIVNTPEQGSMTKASTALLVRSKQMLEAPRNDVAATQLVVPLDGNVDFASLQYSGSSDETLRLRLEAKLRKPNNF